MSRADLYRRARRVTVPCMGMFGHVQMEGPVHAIGHFLVCMNLGKPLLMSRPDLAEKHWAEFRRYFPQ